MFEFEIPGVNGGENSEIFVLEGTDTANASVVEGETTGTTGGESSVADENTESASTEATTFSKSGFENLPEDAGTAERLAYGGKVTLIGMLTVFLVLIILWAVCSLLGKVLGGKGKEQEKKPESAPAPAPAETTNASAGTASAPAAAVDYSMVAVIASASIAAYRGEDTVNFEISSIRPLVSGAVALPAETVAQIAATIACLEGKDTVDFTISSIRVV